jgi:hypothetical protein
MICRHVAKVKPVPDTQRVLYKVDYAAGNKLTPSENPKRSRPSSRFGLLFRMGYQDFRVVVSTFATAFFFAAFFAAISAASAATDLIMAGSRDMITARSSS